MFNIIIISSYNTMHATLFSFTMLKNPTIISFPSLIAKIKYDIS
jgi:hypothetical protein